MLSLFYIANIEDFWW